MIFLVRWLIGGRAAVERAPAIGRAYRSPLRVPLLPAQVRDQPFRRTKLGRRGFDPEDVRNFLAQVAFDLADARAAADRARRETERVKDALRRWQSAQANARDLYGVRR